MRFPRSFLGLLAVVATFGITAGTSKPPETVDAMAVHMAVDLPECDHCDYPCPIVEYGAWFVPGGTDVLHTWDGCIYDVEEDPCTALIHCDEGLVPDQEALDEIEELVAGLSQGETNKLADYLVASGYSFEIDRAHSALRVNGCRGAMQALLPVPPTKVAAVQARVNFRLAEQQ